MLFPLREEMILKQMEADCEVSVNISPAVEEKPGNTNLQVTFVML